MLLVLKLGMLRLLRLCEVLRMPRMLSGIASSLESLPHGLIGIIYRRGLAVIVRLGRHGCNCGEWRLVMGE